MCFQSTNGEDSFVIHKCIKILLSINRNESKTTMEELGEFIFLISLEENSPSFTNGQWQERAPLVAQLVKNLPVMQETQVKWLPVHESVM